MNPSETTATRVAGLALRGGILCLLLGGCRVVGDETGEAGPDEPLLLRDRLGCEEGVGPFLQVDLEDTEISTVPRISWSASETLDVQAVADVGRDTDVENYLFGEPGESGELLFLGLPALTSASIVLTAETSGGLACSDPIDIAPAGLDPGLPELTLSHLDPERAQSGLISTIVISEASRFLVIIDELGEYIWSLDIGEATTSRGNFLLDGSGLIYMVWAAEGNDEVKVPVPDTPGMLYTVEFDGSTRQMLEVDYAHTDFVELPSGAVATLVNRTEEMMGFDGVPVDVLGDALVEVTQEGEISDIWSAFDDHAPVLDGVGNLEKSFSHVNSVSYIEESDDFLVGIANLEMIVRLDKETGDEIWNLADGEGDFSSEEGADLVNGPHSAELLESGELLLFNRMTTGDDVKGACSEAVTLSLDESVFEVEKTWSYSSDDCLLVVFFGEAIRLDGGNTLTVFSSSGQMSQGTPEGDTVWQINTDVGGAFGFADFRSTLH